MSKTKQDRSIGGINDFLSQTGQTVLDIADEVGPELAKSELRQDERRREEVEKQQQADSASTNSGIVINRQQIIFGVIGLGLAYLLTRK